MLHRSDSHRLEAYLTDETRSSEQGVGDRGEGKGEFWFFPSVVSSLQYDSTYALCSGVPGMRACIHARVVRERTRGVETGGVFR